MLNVKTAAAALVVILGASSLAVAAPASKTDDHHTAVQTKTPDPVYPLYEGRSAYDATAYESQLPVQDSHVDMGADNAPARP